MVCEYTLDKKIVSSIVQLGCAPLGDVFVDDSHEYIPY